MTTPISISGFRDLSFDCQGEHCHFSFTEQAAKDLIVFKNLPRVGFVVEIILPEQVVLERLTPEDPVEYDTSVLLGVEDSSSSLFIHRLLLALSRRGYRKPLLILLGFDGLTREQMEKAIDIITSL